MLFPTPNRRALALLSILLPLVLAAVWLALTSGPLAPVPVTVAVVEERAIAPALFGIGTIEARYRYRIGPTVAGRVRRVEVQVGDRVHAGQLLGEMDPVDLDERVAAQDAALRRAEAGVAAARAQVTDARARLEFAGAQVRRYEQLLQARTASEDTVEARRQEAQVAEAGLATALANLESAEQDLLRVRAEREALARQRGNLRLLAPVDGLVVARDAEPGSTVVAGQAVVELVDPATLWIDARFDQLGSGGLRAGLEARIALRSRPSETLAGSVLRVEPQADAVTEELRAKIAFARLPEPLPRLGELAEVTLALASQPPAPALPNAALQWRDGQLGVWRLVDAGPRFAAIETGLRDLDGWVQIGAGLTGGDRVVLYSQAPLRPGRSVKIVEAIPGVLR
ncbi:efflux RND transporter periplasmic adaptor subunit [Thiohalocapsa marina]|uniref:Efflux RND transporter periplasmic adaptor subunit n=1 Tax=Thiohalocapsa marina TaxID=424902 RepID=A0A5M8FMU5_9GAMM|nr:efflux RND transporter periplasmic adaptor subunit [Thiohalocapsa marina]KAA6185320.1 efflux RND transporter periplasmic adaptor subunit [Thiohalocapsa marina]